MPIINHRIIFLILISILAIITRIYNLNYEDFWIDEIISFWIADPLLTTDETILRHNSLEQVPIFFNMVLKYYFGLFGYNAHFGRYLTVFFSILTLITSFLLFKKIKNNNSVIFFYFLMAINIYLIKYSQELRVYSLMLLLITLSLFFLIGALNNRKENTFNYIFFTFFSILSIFSHPFSLIIFFSILSYSFFVLIIKRENIKGLNLSLLIIFLFSFIYYFLYFLNLNEITSWIPTLNTKFFTNYFFSKFFGSRLLGMIHLISLLYLMIYFKKIILNSNLLIFSIIFFYSYLLPILFGLFVKPILVDRYIIYVIPPILIITSILIFEIKNDITKKLIVFIITLLSLLNFFTEDSFKQFYQKTNKYKPNFFQALKTIEMSNNNKFIIKKFETKDPNKNSFYGLLDNAVNDYIKQYVNNKEIDVNLTNISNVYEKKLSNIWIICYYDLDISDCEPPINKKNINISKNINFSRINLIQLNLKH